MSLDSNTTVEGACPVGGDGVQFLEGAEEMLDVFAADIFDSEVIYNKEESYVAGCVLSERWCAGDGGVPMFGKVVLEAIVGNLPCLLEPGHPLADFHVDVSIVGEVL